MTKAPPVPPVADPWGEVSAARVPAAALAALAPLRNREDVRVLPAPGAVWVRWPAGRTEVVHCLLPVAGVEFFVPRNGGWCRFGHRLPTADAPPAGEGRSVATVLGLAPVEPVEPGDTPAPPVPLRVVRGGPPQPVTALACRVGDLAPWADRATTAELERVRAARAGDQAVLLGSNLPAVPNAVRYWGDDLLVPLGFRPDPDLPPAALRAAVGAAADELVVLDESGAERIPRAAFHPLTRAGLRLARREPREGGAP